MDVDTTVNLIYNNACGTCQDVMLCIDHLIEDGDIDQEFFYRNEVAILQGVDNLMFSCVFCGWNYEISEMSSSVDGVCYSCEDEDDESR